MEVVRSVEISRRRFRKGFECNKGAPGRTRKFAIVSHFHDISSSMFHIFFFFPPLFFIEFSECNKSVERNRVTRMARAIVFNFRNSAARRVLRVFHSNYKLSMYETTVQKCPKPVKRNVRWGRRDKSFGQKRAFEHRSLLTMLHSFKMIVVVWSRNSRTHCNLVFRCLCYFMKTTWKKCDFIPLNFLLFVTCWLKWNILMFHYKTFEEE